VRTALRLTVLHWGLHGWALYVVAGLGIAIYSDRHDRPLTFRSALYPVLGRHVDRWPGLAVDLVALFGTVCGVATSIGISAGGMNATLGSLLGVDVSIANQIVIVFGVCGLGILSAVSGLARGIRRLSEVNVWASGLLLLAFALIGPTFFVAGLFVETLIDYAVHALPTGWWLAETPEHQAWQGSWTIFYWGWWLAWTPFVSLFIARISRGRTIREFAVAVMLVPTLVTVLWMSVLGGTALHQEIASPGSVGAAVSQDPSLGMVAVIHGLGSPALATLLTLTAAFLLFTWMITSLDSATLVICHLLGVDEAAPAKVFWGLALAGVTSVLLVVGGLPALQAASVAVGLPLAVVMVFVGGGLLWEFARSRG
jgi:choline/glycine/proline betaine transport protein